MTDQHTWIHDAKRWRGTIIAAIVIAILAGLFIWRAVVDPISPSGGADVSDALSDIEEHRNYCSATYSGWTPTVEQEARALLSDEDLDPFGVNDARTPYYECLDAAYPPWENGY